MCYNSQASIQAFIIGTISSIILYQTDPILSILAFFIYVMQLYDYIFWNNLTKNNINYIFTKIAMITNHLQPIILALAIIYIKKDKLFNIEKISLASYTIIAIIYTIYYWNDINYTLITDESKPSLYWEWNDKDGNILLYLLYLITMLLLLYYHFTFPSNIILIVLFILSFLFSGFYYFKNKAVGRFWCYYAPFIIFIYSCLMFLYKNYNKILY